MRFREKEVRGMGQKLKRIRQKERQDYRQKNKRGGIERRDQTDSPEIHCRHSGATFRGKTDIISINKRVTKCPFGHPELLIPKGGTWWLNR